MVFKKITKERRRKRSWERKGGEGREKEEKCGDERNVYSISQ